MCMRIRTSGVFEAMGRRIYARSSIILILFPLLAGKMPKNELNKKNLTPSQRRKLLEKNRLKEVAEKEKLKKKKLVAKEKERERLKKAKEEEKQKKKVEKEKVDKSLLSTDLFK